MPVAALIVALQYAGLSVFPPHRRGGVAWPAHGADGRDGVVAGGNRAGAGPREVAPPHRGSVSSITGARFFE